MHSLGNSAKWPSYDSLPSTSSFLLSESDLTEDEADVFSSEGEGESGGSKSSVGEGDRVPRLRLAFVGQDRFRAESGQAECCPHTATYPPLETPAGATTLGTEAISQGDQAFTRKCTELQRFIRPLLELLNGLKTGRFERGLSSFQQSVAMDRLQRILGILQKPDMGEKYLRTLLQVEVMLKMWFPQVTREPLAPSTQSLRSNLPPRWHQNQLHIPVKKRKLSWSDSDFPSAGPPHCKRLQQEESYLPVPSREPANCGSHPVEPRKQREPQRGDIRQEGGGWTLGRNLSDMQSRRLHLCDKREKGGRKLEITPPSPCGSPATQDSSVSSTIAVADSLQIPLHGEQPLRCCSASGTAQAGGGPAMTSEDFERRSRCHSASLRPLSREEEEGLGSFVST